MIAILLVWYTILWHNVDDELIRYGSCFTTAVEKADIGREGVVLGSPLVLTEHIVIEISTFSTIQT